MKRLKMRVSILNNDAFFVRCQFFFFLVPHDIDYATLKHALMLQAPRRAKQIGCVRVPVCSASAF